MNADKMPSDAEDYWNAAGHGNVDRLRFHLDAGVDINARGHAGINALGYAAAEGHVEAVAFLLARGADPNAIGYDDWTPVGLAAYGGSVDCIRLLLDAGADISRGHLNSGESPLHLAAVKCREAAVAYL